MQRRVVSVDLHVEQYLKYKPEGKMETFVYNMDGSKVTQEYIKAK